MTLLWPEPPRELGLDEALGLAGRAGLAAELSRTRAGVDAARGLLESPILAVLGQLNAGKSSLVASFLAPANRLRLPRGAGSAQGTHRFVYWVPQAWLEDESRRAALEKLLAAAHGNGLERLATAPVEAARQYAAGRDDLERLRLPLLAGDPMLDRLGFALLDCPDIQTRDRVGSRDGPDCGGETDSFGAESENPGPATGASGRVTNPRLEFLVAAAQVCSAFVVVWRRDALRDSLLEELLGELRGRLPRAPLQLAVNFLRPAADEPAATLHEPDLTRLVDQHGIAPAHRFVAFDQLIEARGERPGWRERTPGQSPEPGASLSAGEETSGEPLPIFYRAPTLGAGDVLDPASVPDGDLLAALPAQLDLAELQRCHLADQQHLIELLEQRAANALADWARAENEATAASHAGLLELCREQLTDKSGQPLQVPSPQFAEALSQAMITEAPLLLRGLLQVARPFEKALDGAKAAVGELRKLASPGRQGDALKEAVGERLQIGRLKLAGADDLARAMQARRWCPAELATGEIESAWTTILRDLYDHPVETIDQDALHDLAGGLWRDLPLGKKLGVGARAALGALGSVAAVGGVLVALADGGALYLGATAIANALHGGLAAAIAAAGGLGAGFAFSRGLLETNTLPWLARLFALACDHFGLPRRLPGAEAPEVAFRLGDRQERRRLPDDPLPRRAVTLKLGEPRWLECAED